MLVNYNSQADNRTGMFLSKYVEMSRSWSSAHDWKSCRGQKLLESSNLSISAMKNTLPPSGGGVFFIKHGEIRMWIEGPGGAFIDQFKNWSIL